MLMIKYNFRTFNNEENISQLFQKTQIHFEFHL